MKFLTNIDLNKNQLFNVTLQNLATAPASPNAGQIYYDTALNTARQWNGTVWVAFDATKAAVGSIPLNTLVTDPLARANHTGTQTASTISNLATTVQAYTLNQFAAPTANVAMGGFTLTGLAAPTASGQAATYDFVLSQTQSSAAGISSKPAVAVVSTANVATLSGLPTVDGQTLVDGQRVLLTAQSTASQNGPWVVHSGAWTRPTTDANNELDLGAMWLVETGTSFAASQWRISLPQTGTITPGTTAITIVQFGAGMSYTAGNGITLSGSAFAVGAGTGIAVSTGTTSIDTTVVARKYTATIGDGSATSYTVTHNLNNQSPTYQVWEVSTNAAVQVDVVASSVNALTVTFASAPAANSYRVSVLG